MAIVRSPSSRRRVRVVAPSSPFPEERLAKGVERLVAAGFDVDDTSDVLTGAHAYLNGSDDERQRALESALASDVDVLWIARGGYGLTRLVSRLALANEQIPVVVGFSDATALHARLWQRGYKSVHGPLVTSVAEEPDETFEHLLRVLEGRAAGTVLDGLRVLSAKDAHEEIEGPLFAANLCVLSHLVGTPGMPDLAGAVLVLEEVGERPYRIDRMLTQLKESSALDGVAAVVLGHLTGCEEPAGSARLAPSAEGVFVERLSSLGVPVTAGLAAGHTAPNYALPVGARVRLTVRHDVAALHLLEEVTGARGVR